MDNDILDRLEAHNVYCEDCDSKQLRKDSAEEIRSLRRQVAELEALIRRRASQRMARGVAA